MRQQGMILLTTLLFLIALASSLMLQLQALFIYNKINHQAELRLATWGNLEQLANRIRLGWDGGNHNSRIIIDNVAYNYNIENLGLYPCVKIMHKKKMYGTQHGLLTLWQQDAQEMQLELRIAIMHETPPCNIKDERYLTTSVVAWQKINMPAAGVSR